MTYSRYDTRAGGEFGRNIAWTMGPYAMNLHDYRSGVRPELTKQMDAFDELWDALKDNLQEPIRDEGGQFSGYSGHRIVTFEDEMGRCALGFYLSKIATDLYRSITASRRKLYEDDSPKIVLLSDEAHLGMSDVRHHDTCDDSIYEHRLGEMAVWVDKYLAAEPYEELPYYDK